MLGLIFAVAIFGNAAGFFKNFSSFGTFCANDLSNTALADNGISIAAHAGIQKQLIDILQAHRLPVQRIFTFTAAVILATDHHFVGIDIQAAIAVVYRKRHTGKAHGPAHLCAAKDHILHFAAAAQLSAAGFAQHPANGIGYIAFAAAVGPHHSRDARLDQNSGAVGKAFESLDFKLFQYHCVFFLLCPCRAAQAAALQRQPVFVLDQVSPIRRRASRAACCSACFLLRPSPWAKQLELRCTATTKCLSWSGPVSLSST